MVIMKVEDLCHLIGGFSHGTELQVSEAIATQTWLVRAIKLFDALWIEIIDGMSSI